MFPPGDRHRCVASRVLGASGARGQASSARLTPKPQRSFSGVPCLRGPLPAAGMPARPCPPRASRTQLQREHLSPHVSLHVEDRTSAESFRHDCSAPTPSGHQACRQGLSLRATTGGGSQPQQAHRSQRRPGKGRLFLCCQPVRLRQGLQTRATRRSLRLR